MSAWTVRQVVAWTAEDFERRGIDSPRLDAELLVSVALDVDRVRLYMDLERPLSEPERDAIRELVKRRRAREPIAYILGHREFYGRRFEVSPAVLIPRPDTETLVERALEILDPDATGPVLDLCTGSGAIGLTLAAERASLEVDLTDISASALAVARKNAEQLEVADRVRLFEADLFVGLPERAYELITINPPYIADSEVAALAPEVADHEPRIALVAAADGFAMHRRFVAAASRWLTPGGRVLIEVGAGQAGTLEAELSALDWVRETTVHDDLNRIARAVEARAANSV